MATPERSTRRPEQQASRKQMHVQVKDALPGLFAVIDDQTKIFFATQRARDLTGFEQQMPQYLLIVGGGVGDFRDGFFRDDQNVDGGLRVDVLERQTAIILIDDIGGYLARDDLAENCPAHESDTL